jgi:hypothetical protein
MSTKEKRDISREAEEFAQKAALVIGESSFGGENLCDPQREVWLDIARRGYRKAVEEGQKDLEKIRGPRKRPSYE